MATLKSIPKIGENLDFDAYVDDVMGDYPEFLNEGMDDECQYLADLCDDHEEVWKAMAHVEDRRMEELRSNCWMEFSPQEAMSDLWEDNERLREQQGEQVRHNKWVTKLLDELMGDMIHRQRRDEVRDEELSRMKVEVAFLNNFVEEIQDQQLCRECFRKRFDSR
jgi:hypothetical protein